MCDACKKLIVYVLYERQREIIIDDGGKKLITKSRSSAETNTSSVASSKIGFTRYIPPRRFVRSFFSFSFFFVAEMDGLCANARRRRAPVVGFLIAGTKIMNFN